INYFASGTGGAVSLLTYAKQLFNVPVALGQAAGAASLPFLASLFFRPDRASFSRSVNAAVSKILAFSILLTGYLIAMAYPAVDVVFRAGHLRPSLLRRRQHPHPHDRRNHRHRLLAPRLLVPLPRLRTQRPRHRLR